MLAAAFVCSVVLTAVVRGVAMRYNFVARPANDRYHRSVIPLGGGIAIFWTIALFMIAALAGVHFVGGDASGIFDPSASAYAAGVLNKSTQLIVVIASLLALHLLGLYDDKKHLGPYFKLSVQFAIAITMAFFGDIRFSLFIHSQAVTGILSAVWLVLLINMFNFLDNMDGLCAGIAVIITAILFWTTLASTQVFIGAFALVLAGALLGFLVFNFPPASVFMGDAGSLVIGASIAILTTRTTYLHHAHSGKYYAVLMPLVILAVPLYDFLSVTFLRIRQGKSPFIGDTQHFSHRLKRRGLTDRQVAYTLYLATFCTGLSATFLPQVDLLGALMIFTQTVLIMAIIAIFEKTNIHAL